MQEIADFVSARYSPAAKWKREELLNYIQWALANEFLLIARGYDNEIVGAALVRPCARFPETDAEYDRQGKVAHIDFMVADSSKAFLLLSLSVLAMHKRCDSITFQRFQRSNAKKQYSYNHVKKTVFKLKNKLANNGQVIK